MAPFFADLPNRIAGSHLVVSRAGASTVTELSIIGRPSILVPLAIAMDDHQTGNARVLSEAGGAILLPEKDFNETSARRGINASARETFPAGLRWRRKPVTECGKAPQPRSPIWLKRLRDKMMRKDYERKTGN